jgi:protein-disulfide isomerase
MTRLDRAVVAVLPLLGSWAATAAPPAAPATPLAAFPAVDLARLNAAQQSAFADIANEEMCPCACPTTLGACLQNDHCKPAKLLGAWLIDVLADDVAPKVLHEAVTRELTAGFPSAPRTPDLQGYATKGSNHPTFTVVEYSDFECPHCRAAAPVINELVKAHPEVRVVFKHFPLQFHAMARRAAQAAEAAGRQGKFWQMHDAIFATQDLLSDELLLGHAKALGLDLARFQKDLDDPEIAKRVEASRAEALSFGVDSTPSFLINGRPYHLARSLDGFELRLQMEAARAGSSCP